MQGHCCYPGTAALHPRCSCHLPLPDLPALSARPAAGVLKWRLQTRDESQVPLTINCWPSVSGADSYVNIEYEATAPFDLHKVGPNPSHLAPVGGRATYLCTSVPREGFLQGLWVWAGGRASCCGGDGRVGGGAQVGAITRLESWL